MTSYYNKTLKDYISHNHHEDFKFDCDRGWCRDDEIYMFGDIGGEGWDIYKYNKDSDRWDRKDPDVDEGVQDVIEVMSLYSLNDFADEMVATVRE